jgi:hypothetical protein
MRNEAIKPATSATIAIIGTPPTRAVATTRNAGAMTKPGMARLASSEALPST